MSSPTTTGIARGKKFAWWVIGIGAILIGVGILWDNYASLVTTSDGKRVVKAEVRWPNQRSLPDGQVPNHPENKCPIIKTVHNFDPEPGGTKLFEAKKGHKYVIITEGTRRQRYQEPGAFLPSYENVNADGIHENGRIRIPGNEGTESHAPLPDRPQAALVLRYDYRVQFAGKYAQLLATADGPVVGDINLPLGTIQYGSGSNWKVIILECAPPK